MIHSRLLYFLFFSIVAFSPLARAQFHTGPIASSMGGAGRAAVDPGEIHFLNPAAVAHLSRYYVSGNYGTIDHPAVGNMSQYGVLFADGSASAMVNGAFSYQRVRTDRGRFGDTQQDFQLTLAGFVSKPMAFGLALHRLTDLLNSGEETAQINAHTGVLINPNENFGIGITVHDFWPVTESVSRDLQVIPTFGLGAHWIIRELFRLRMDLVRPLRGNDRGRNDVAAGMETFFHPQFAFRAGYQWRETRDQNWLSAGFGFRGPRLSFDYSFQKDTRTSEGTRHFVDLWLPL